MNFLFTKIFFILLFLNFLVACKAEGSIEPDYKNLPEYDCTIVPEITCDPSKKNMLVVGDSISLLYTQALRDNAPSYNVVHNACNAGFSGHAALKIDEYLAQEDHWDVIIFNVGIWDLNTVEIPVSSYAKNLEYIASKIKQTGARSIFLTTTAHPNFPSKKAEMKRRALEIMKKLDIEVFDLGDYSTSILFLKELDLVHYNEEGSRRFASKIIDYINR